MLKLTTTITITTATATTTTTNKLTNKTKQNKTNKTNNEQDITDLHVMHVTSTATETEHAKTQSPVTIHVNVTLDLTLPPIAILVYPDTMIIHAKLVLTATMAHVMTT